MAMTRQQVVDQMLEIGAEATRSRKIKQDTSLIVGEHDNQISQLQEELTEAWAAIAALEEVVLKMNTQKRGKNASEEPKEAA